MIMEMLKNCIPMEMIIGAVRSMERAVSTRHGVDETAEKRRAWDREYRRRKRGVSADPPDVHPKTPDIGNDALSSLKEDKKHSEVVIKKEKKERGHKLPPDWKPNQHHYDEGAKLGLDRAAVDARAERMREWCAANANRSVTTKANWDAAFLGTWIKDSRNGHGFSNNRTNHAPGSAPTRDTAVLAGMGRALERRRAARAADDGDKFNDLMVLPPDLMPSSEQRQMMIGHRDSLRSSLLDTPAVSVVAETKVATAVSKLLTVLAGERKSDLVEEARSDVYLDVLDDIAWWAVDSAARAWFKHDCGTDERGRPYDYKWPPDPGTLRKIALKFTYQISVRIETMHRVLEAREYVDCTKQLAAGRAALAGLNKAIRAGDLDTARTLTLDQAVKFGSSNETKKTFMLVQEEAAE